jgi:hypothetical protein
LLQGRREKATRAQQDEEEQKSMEKVEEVEKDGEVILVDSALPNNDPVQRPEMGRREVSRYFGWLQQRSWLRASYVELVYRSMRSDCCNLGVGFASDFAQ